MIFTEEEIASLTKKGLTVESKYLDNINASEWHK